MSRVSRALGKLAKLSLREWRELVEAELALFSAQLLVWMRPTGRLVAGTVPASTPAAEPECSPDPRAARWALAVERAAEHGLFRPLCLVRAVALHRLLERHGIHGSRIRIGVRLQDGRFAAHAWVEHRARALGEDAERVGAFAELADVQLVDTL